MAKKLLRYFSKYALILGATLSAAYAAETNDWIVAVVNDDVILNSQVQQEIAILEARLQNSGQQAPPRRTLVTSVVNLLIDNQLQLQRARLLGVNVNPAELEQTVAEIANNAGVSVEQYARFQGMTAGQLRGRVAEEMLMSEAMQLDNRNKVRLQETEINELLRARLADPSRQEYLLQHAHVAADATALAEQLQQTHGEEFAQLAADVSISDEDVELGWRLPNELPQAFLAAVAELPHGSNSEVLELDNGLHVLRLVAKRPVVPGESRIVGVSLKLLQGDASTVTEQQMIDVRNQLVRGDTDFEQAAASINGTVEVVDFPYHELPVQLANGLRVRLGEIDGPFVLEDQLVVAMVLDATYAMLGDESVREQLLPVINSVRLQDIHAEWIKRLRLRGTVEILREPS